MADNPIFTRGATITDLSQLFGLDRTDIRKRIAGIAPLPGRSGIDMWRVRDVASRLVKFDDSMTDLIAKILATHHTDLPKMLSKEFWYGQNQRLKYLQAVGELWDTSAVVELASEVFKVLRLSLMLAQDTVERETGLTPKQREIIENLMHEALNDAREKLVVRLTDLRKNTSGKAFTPSETTSANGIGSGGDAGNLRDEWGDPIRRKSRPGDADYI
jgi:Protein of unknown function (DUF1441)